MKCYLINLDRSKDRFDWIKRQADPLGISLRRVSAVDGRTLSESEIEKWNSVRSDLFGMGPGEFGCFLSHRRAWQLLVDQEEPWGFIAEDDIHFSATASEFLRDDQWIPRDADIVKAETARQRVWLSSKPIATAFAHRLHRLQSSHGGSAGYFVSRIAAQRLIDATSTFCSTLDQILFNPVLEISLRFTIYQIDPAICIQDWCVQPNEGGMGLESLLLSERHEFHGLKCKQRRSGAMWCWYKVSNPAKKLTHAGLAFAANRLGTHTVKKIPFQETISGEAGRNPRVATTVPLGAQVEINK